MAPQILDTRSPERFNTKIIYKNLYKVADRETCKVGSKSNSITFNYAHSKTYLIEKSKDINHGILDILTKSKIARIVQSLVLYSLFEVINSRRIIKLTLLT